MSRLERFDDIDQRCLIIFSQRSQHKLLGLVCERTTITPVTLHITLPYA
jgi:hypothetical protein